MMNHFIPILVALPLAGAFILPLIPKRAARAPDLVGNAILALLFLMSLASMGAKQVYHVGAWPTPLGIDLRLDGLATLVLLAISGIGLAATLYSVDYMKQYTAKRYYYSLFLLMVAGMNGVVLANDLFNLYVFMEIAAVASYALVAYGCEAEELEASFKYAILGSVASGLILIGIAVLYAMTGTLNMVQMAEHLAAEAPPTAPVLFATGLLIAGFSLKAALVPFHAWLPDAHPSAPAPISAMLSGVLIKAVGAYVLARVLFNVVGVTEDLLFILRTLGVVSMVVGVLLALGQWDMKRLFAYHSISQIGYVVLGLGLGTPLGIVGGLFHMVNHSVFKSLLFLNAGSVERAGGTRDLRRMGGLGARMPVTAATSMTASLSIAGIPPFNGFWSKLIIVLACVQAGYYVLGLWAVLVSLITLASFMKVQRYAFSAGRPAALTQVRRAPPLMAAAMILLACGCLLMSLLVVSGFESPILIGPAAEVLLEGVFRMPMVL